MSYIKQKKQLVQDFVQEALLLEQARALSDSFRNMKRVKLSDNGVYSCPDCGSEYLLEEDYRILEPFGNGFAVKCRACKRWVYHSEEGC